MKGASLLTRLRTFLSRRRSSMYVSTKHADCSRKTMQCRSTALMVLMRNDFDVAAKDRLASRQVCIKFLVLFFQRPHWLLFRRLFGQLHALRCAFVTGSS